jgi:hypothetical protein
MIRLVGLSQGRLSYRQCFHIRQFEGSPHNGGRVLQKRFVLSGGKIRAWRQLSSESRDAVIPVKPRLLRVLGPGLITGAADDDPSGIATYSQAGAQLGFAITWTMLFSYPLTRLIHLSDGHF